MVQRALVGFSLGLAGLGLFSPSVTATTPMKQSPAALMGKTWQLTQWDGEALLPNTEIVLTFAEQNLVGSGGCNRFRGTYQVQPPMLKVNEAIATTRKACPRGIMAQENRFLQGLAQVNRFSLTPEGDLNLYYNHQGQTKRLFFQAQGSTASLEKQTWQLTQLGEQAIKTTKPPTLTFQGKSFSGSGGCNRLVGQFETSGERLLIKEPIASTMMACAEPLMQQEQQFIQALQQAKRYQINENRELIIYFGQGNSTASLVFKPVGMP
ncbi:META domain-containing protein [Synechocystis sp. LKSZ1]|uniref:META domain-containing protein n=1 Tax=Synechocystis sp. LKSZ1 TaxID=3144951 RepID=UPI00336BD3BE